MGVFNPCRMAACRAADPRLEDLAPGVDVFGGGISLVMGIAVCVVLAGVVDEDDEDSVRTDSRM